MPGDFPPWEWDRVYAFFRRWRDHGLVKEFHDRLRWGETPAMRVRRLQVIHPAADVPVAEFDGIRVGGVYPVLEMVTCGIDCQIRVLGPGTPDPGLLWNPADFETVDTRIPSGWTLVIASGRTRLADARWQRPGFWTDYAQGDPQALADYEHVKRELLVAAPPPED